MKDDLSSVLRKLYEKGYDDIIPDLRDIFGMLAGYLVSHPDARHRAVGIELDDLNYKLMLREVIGGRPTNTPSFMTLYLIERFKEDYSVDLMKDVMAMNRVKEFAEQFAREGVGELLEKGSIDVNLPFLSCIASGPIDLRYTITKQEYMDFLFESNLSKHKLY